MSSVSVDHKEARSILEFAIKEVDQHGDTYTAGSEKSNEISEVIRGSHKTYRYVLLNGILAKATNRNANPLSLQAQADIDGAFDARSLCHSVVVPMERELLQNRLGGSNEPFLNKPARYPTLSTENAVRRGNDRRLLELTIAVFEWLNKTNSDQVELALSDAIYFTKLRTGRVVSEVKYSETAKNDGQKIMDVLLRLIENSCEGESATIAVATALEIQFYQNEFDVRVHPTNQAGSSSKEIADIDLFYMDKPFLGFEVKDKQFADQDIQHAALKASENSIKSLIFVAGYQSKFQEQKILVQFENAVVTLIAIREFLEASSIFWQPVGIDAVVEIIHNIATKIRAKDETHNWVESVLGH